MGRSVSALRPSRRRAGYAGCAVAALIAACAAPAAVREPADARLPTWEQSHSLEGNQATRTLRAFAYCTVRVRTAAAETLVASLPYSVEERAALDLLVAGEDHPCVYQAERLTIRGAPLIRGIIAEFLYNRADRAAGGHAPRPFEEPFDPSAPEWRGTADGALGRWLAACAVHRVPDRVHALLRFNHDSPGETRTLRAIRPILLDCLPPGRALRVSRLSIRAMLAEALLRFSRGIQGVGQRT